MPYLLVSSPPQAAEERLIIKSRTHQEDQVCGACWRSVSCVINIHAKSAFAAELRRRRGRRVQWERSDHCVHTHTHRGPYVRTCWRSVSCVIIIHDKFVQCVRLSVSHEAEGGSGLVACRHCV